MTDADEKAAASVLDLRALATTAGTDNRYVGQVTRVQDGDTIHVSVLDPLLSVPVVLSVRIAGINAPELHEPGGREVTAALAEWLPSGRVVTLTGVKPDKFAGRTLASVQTASGDDVATWLIVHQYAVEWSGVGTKPLVPWPPKGI